MNILRVLDRWINEPPKRCEVPPQGWYCTRKAGHDGPCAALPYDYKQNPFLNPEYRDNK